GYPNGEVHRPLGLEVHEEDYAWSLPGYDGIAGVQYTITNRGSETLHGVYLGVLADLDSRGENDRLGHLNDLVVSRGYRRSFSDGSWDGIDVNGTIVNPLPCGSSAAQTVPVVIDGAYHSTLPAIAIVGE